LLRLLIQAREQRGLSQQQLADLIGLTPDLVKSYEAGEVFLAFHDAKKWFEALDIPHIHHILPRFLNEENDQSATPMNENNPNPESTPSQSDVPTIQVLYFAPGAAPQVRKITNTLDAMQELVDGYISPFRTGIPGTVGVASDEGIVHGMEFNRHIPATGAQIFGPFFVAGDAPDFRSLTPLEMEQALDALAPELSQADFREIMLTHDEGKRWVENWE
jgi:transcriptional regulator with XRE-family HTH domain